MNVEEIKKAMTGRRVAAVNDTRLQEALRLELTRLANMQGRPIPSTEASRVASAVLQAAARTDLFEDEIVIALRAGIAGEFHNEDRRLIPTNVSHWLSVYAACGDRHAAINSISVCAAIARRTADSVLAEEKKRQFQESGLSRAWETFMAEGWDFREGYGAALYDKIGKDAVIALLSPESVNRAKAEALYGVRKGYRGRYRSMADDEIRGTAVFKMHCKSELVRAYFETLQARGLDITFNPAQI